jgi:two-component sensor histidine kinase
MWPTSTIDDDADSLGLGIMQAFARQLGGSLEVLPAAGTVLSVEFGAN